jgi:hypothetical protein
VTGDFDDVFTGEGARGVHDGEEDFIEVFVVAHNMAIMNGMGLSRGNAGGVLASRDEATVGECQGIFSRNANDSDAAFTKRGSNRGNGIIQHGAKVTTGWLGLEVEYFRIKVGRNYARRVDGRRHREEAWGRLASTVLTRLGADRPTYYFHSCGSRPKQFLLRRVAGKFAREPGIAKLTASLARTWQVPGPDTV